MARKIVKKITPPATAEPKQVAKKRSAVSSEKQVLKVCELALEKLNSLDIEHQLQAEMNWCIGSFKADGNPSGLYQMVERAALVFRDELAKKTKGINIQFIGVLESVLKNQ